MRLAGAVGLCGRSVLERRVEGETLVVLRLVPTGTND